MSGIPPDIYERVHELALAIANASEAGDDALADSHCQDLRAYFDRQSAVGRSHPFLTEALADYTDDPIEAIRLYQLALWQAHEYPDEPTHTKMISLAARLLELGRKEEADTHWRDGLAEAGRRGDRYWVGEANRLLR